MTVCGCGVPARVPVDGVPAKVVHAGVADAERKPHRCTSTRSVLSQLFAFLLGFLGFGQLLRLLELFLIFLRLEVEEKI